MSGVDFRRPAGQLELSVLLLGASAVGKSSLIRSFVGENFRFTNPATVGVDMKRRTVELEKRNKIVTLTLLDAAGQNTFESIVMSYFRSADFYALIFDVTSKSSFEEVDNWMKRLNDLENMAENCIFVIGNKVDLEKEWKVSETELTNFCNGFPDPKPIPFLASAKTGELVEDVFTEMCEIVLDRMQTKKEKDRRSTIDTTLDPPKNSPKPKNSDDCGCLIL
ncbi:ras-related protein Rab-4-like [Symsagittifera roscoffensis]|uniref:ras-related protein Rab-4-like n=1 Tax=Symsagittifera roscoffensis TaxID=84072 RepID=UPI00307C1E53